MNFHFLKTSKEQGRKKKSGYESAAEPTHLTHIDKAPPIPLRSHTKPIFSPRSLQFQIEAFNSRPWKSLQHSSVS